MIRLFGIDSPEVGQLCTNPSGKDWDCGKVAATHLGTLVRGHTVTCKGSQYDAYDRLLAVCETPHTPDVNHALVAAGMAIAYRRYSERYADAEQQAQNNKTGIWATRFERPSQYRRQAWETASNRLPKATCPIKGNINRRGERIYHTRWSPVYHQTKINLKKGERWFCTEKEAVDAGWRSSLLKSFQ